MANFNKVILMGNLTRDPELTFTASNMAICKMGLAVNRKWKSKDGSPGEETSFIDLTAFGKQAETLEKFFSKGKPILVEGRLKQDTWEGKDGNKRSKVGVIVENFTFVGDGVDRGETRRPERTSADDAARNYNQEAPPPPSGDDIPF